MKQFKIRITRDSLNMKKEFRIYSWAKNKNWELLNKPIDSYNHCIDAARYWIIMKYKKQRVWKFIIDTF